MPTVKLDPAAYVEVTAYLERFSGNIQRAQANVQTDLGISSDTFATRVRRARQDGLWGRRPEGGIWTRNDILLGRQGKAAPAVPMAADLPDDDIPVDDLIDTMCRRYAKRAEHASAKKWRRFTVPVDGPYALMFVGDPHIDDNGCDWPTLRAHCDLSRKTPAMFAVNIGDTTNNWCGRLAHLWSQQDTSQSTARKLVKWFLNDAGMRWFLWVHGNHDAWSGPVGTETLERFRPNQVAMEDWGAKVTLVSPGGSEFRVHVAHDFPGHSQWNPLHGPQKEALWGDHAHVYAAGHKHNWALFNNEHSHRNTVYWLLRARGYKAIDTYGERLGYGSQGHGQSVVAVVDPEARETGHVTCFAEPFEAADYLNFKRRKTKA
jgi:hypothetical protein